jgi:hypothetical protein
MEIDHSVCNEQSATSIKLKLKSTLNIINTKKKVLGGTDIDLNNKLQSIIRSLAIDLSKVWCLGDQTFHLLINKYCEENLIDQPINITTFSRCYKKCLAKDFKKGSSCPNPNELKYIDDILLNLLHHKPTDFEELCRDYHNFSIPLEYCAETSLNNAILHLRTNFFKYFNNYIKSRVRFDFVDINPEISRSDINLLTSIIKGDIIGYGFKPRKPGKIKRVQYLRQLYPEIECFITREKILMNESIDNMDLLKHDNYVLDDKIVKVNMMKFIKYFHSMLKFLNFLGVEGFTIVPVLKAKIRYIRFPKRILCSIYNDVMGYTEDKEHKVDDLRFEKNFNYYFKEMFNVRQKNRNLLKKYPVINSILTDGHIIVINFLKKDSSDEPDETDHEEENVIYKRKPRKQFIPEYTEKEALEKEKSDMVLETLQATMDKEIKTIEEKIDDLKMQMVQKKQKGKKKHKIDPEPLTNNIQTPDKDIIKGLRNKIKCIRDQTKVEMKVIYDDQQKVITKKKEDYNRLKALKIKTERNNLVASYKPYEDGIKKHNRQIANLTRTYQQYIDLVMKSLKLRGELSKLLKTYELGKITDLEVYNRETLKLNQELVDNKRKIFKLFSKNNDLLFVELPDISDFNLDNKMDKIQNVIKKLRDEVKREETFLRKKKGLPEPEAIINLEDITDVNIQLNGLYNIHDIRCEPDYTKKFRVVSVDPGNNPMGCFVCDNGIHVDIHKNEYRDLAHIPRNKEKQEAIWRKSKMECINHKLSLTTRKTYSSEELMKYINVVRENWKDIWAYQSKIELLNLKFDSYNHGQKAIHEMAMRTIERLNDTNNIHRYYKGKDFDYTTMTKKIIIFYGAGNGSMTISNTKGSSSKGPVKRLMEELSKHVVVIQTPEPNTSKLCNLCHNELEPVKTYHFPSKKKMKKNMRNKLEKIRLDETIIKLKIEKKSNENNIVIVREIEEKINKKIDELKRKIVKEEVTENVEKISRTKELRENIKKMRKEVRENRMSKEEYEKRRSAEEKEIEDLKCGRVYCYQDCYSLRCCAKCTHQKNKQSKLFERNYNAALNIMQLGIMLLETGTYGIYSRKMV